MHVADFKATMQCKNNTIQPPCFLTDNFEKNEAKSFEGKTMESCSTNGDLWYAEEFGTLKT